MKIKNSLICASLCAILMAPQSMFAIMAIGNAEMPIGSSDPQTVISLTEKNALADAVVDAISQTLGADVPANDPSILKLIKRQDTFLKSTPKIVKDRSDSSKYAVKVTLDIDETKFSEQLKNVGVGLSSDAKSLGAIVIFIDEATKINTASASDVPMEEKIDYKRDNSKNYKENSSKSAASSSASSASISDKESASYSAKSSASGKSSSQASYDQKVAGQLSSSANIAGNGSSASAQDSASMSASAKGSAKQSASYANSQEEKAAYNKNLQASSSNSASSSSASAKNVNSQVNDKEEFHYSKTVNMAALRPQSTTSDGVKNKLTATLKKYGLVFVDGSGMLDEFSKISKPKVPYTSYADVMKRDKTKYLNFVKSKLPNANYTGIGSLVIGHSLQKDSVGEFKCGLNEGTINVISLKNNEVLAADSLQSLHLANATQEGCMLNVRISSAEELGQKIGASIQTEVRDSNVKMKTFK